MLHYTLQKLGYFHKKSEIDYAVAGRVHKLYKILERRFQGDVKIWLSHIDFQKRMVRKQSRRRKKFFTFQRRRLSGLTPSTGREILLMGITVGGQLGTCT